MSAVPESAATAIVANRHVSGRQLAGTGAAPLSSYVRNHGWTTDRARNASATFGGRPFEAAGWRIRPVASLSGQCGPSQRVAARQERRRPRTRPDRRERHRDHLASFRSRVSALGGPG